MKKIIYAAPLLVCAVAFALVLKAKSNPNSLLERNLEALTQTEDYNGESCYSAPVKECEQWIFSPGKPMEVVMWPGVNWIIIPD